MHVCVFVRAYVCACVRTGIRMCVCVRVCMCYLHLKHFCLTSKECVCLCALCVTHSILNNTEYVAVSILLRLLLVSEFHHGESEVVLYRVAGRVGKLPWLHPRCEAAQPAPGAAHQQGGHPAVLQRLRAGLLLLSLRRIPAAL